MSEKVNILKMVLKGIKHIFAFGYFSNPPFFFLTLILFLALLFKIFYKFAFFREPTFLSYISLVVFFVAEVLVLLIFLVTHLTSYEFVKEMNCFKTSEFDKGLKKKNFFKKKDYFKGTIIDNNFFNFLISSFYQGFIIMDRPFWLTKVLFRTFRTAIKNKRQGFHNMYGWRKLYDVKQKDFIYYPFVLGFDKR